MAGTLTPIDFDPTIHPQHPRTPSQYVNTETMTAATQANITIPAGAQYVYLETTADTWFKFSNSGSLPTLSVPAGSIEDGTGLERLNQYKGKWFNVKAYNRISVIAAGTPTVSATFYAQ